MAERAVNVAEHAGVAIRVELPSGVFAATAEGRKFHADTFVAIVKKIDRLKTLALKRRTLALPVIDAHGAEQTVTGINLHTGHLTGIVEEQYYGHGLYPATGYVRELIRRRRGLMDQVHSLDKLLGPLEIKDRGYRTDLSPENYEQRLAEVEAEYAKRRQLALGPEEE